jgi:hypothetical protein
MHKLSIGVDSTLGNYKKLCMLFFGPDSGPTKFIEKKIAESEKGEDEEVIADETQMIWVLTDILKKEQEEKDRALLKTCGVTINDRKDEE